MSKSMIRAQIFKRHAYLNPLAVEAGRVGTALPGGSNPKSFPSNQASLAAAAMLRGGR